MFDANLSGWKERGARDANAAVSVFYVWAFGGFVEIAVNTCKCFFKLQLSPPGPGLNFFWIHSNSFQNLFTRLGLIADLDLRIRNDPEDFFNGKSDVCFKFSTHKRNLRWPGV